MTEKDLVMKRGVLMPGCSTTYSTSLGVPPTKRVLTTLNKENNGDASEVLVLWGLRYLQGKGPPRRFLESEPTEHLPNERYLKKILDMRSRQVHINQIKVFLPGEIRVLLAGPLLRQHKLEAIHGVVTINLYGRIYRKEIDLYTSDLTVVILGHLDNRNHHIFLEVPS